jgi:signal peptidase I
MAKLGEKLGKVLLWTAIVVGAIVLVLRVLVLKSWTVPTDPQLAASVAPTLDGGDVVLLLTRGTPGFGDLVRCKDPDDASQYIVGRILGVENDVVEVSGRQVKVNGKLYMPAQACSARKYTVVHPSSEEELPLECGVVEMGGGWHYRAHTKSNILPVSSKTEVGAGMVFLLSDDIDLHDDSRDFGTIERSTCTERVLFRLWSKAGWSDVDARMTYIH